MDMRVRDFGAIVLLAAIWGVSFLLIRIAAPVLGPIVLVNLRMLLASGVLLIYAMLTKREGLDLRNAWKPYLILGALNSMLPLTLEAIAVVHLNASLVAILATTAPLFTALVAALWLREQLTLTRSIGLLLGLLGVVLLVGWSPLVLTIPALLAIGAALLSSLLYAVAGIYAKRAFQGTPALSLAIGQELAAGVLLLPFALATPPTTMPTMPVIAATISLALIMTAGGNLLYFYLIARIGPTKTQSVSFLIPVFALLAGTLVLDEPFTASMLLGLGVIFLSVALVTELRVPQFNLLPTLRSQLHIRSQRFVLQSASAGGKVGSRMLEGASLRGRNAVPIMYDRHSAPVRTRHHDLAAC
jgi:drug/metabolite transporter (DMT)-like permease